MAQQPNRYDWKLITLAAIAAALFVGVVMGLADAGARPAALGGAAGAVAAAAYVFLQRTCRTDGVQGGSGSQTAGAHVVAGPGTSANAGGASGAALNKKAEALTTLENMLKRSSDAMGTLKDIAHNADGTVDFSPLPELLERAGLDRWPSGAATRANRLRRNGRLWINCSQEGFSQSDYDLLVGIEAAVNLYEDLASFNKGRNATEGVREILANVADLKPRPDSDKDSRLYAAGEKDGEWRARVALATLCENLPAPYRVVVNDLQVNVAAGVACVGVGTPAAASFAVAGDDGTSQRELALMAQAYALRLSWALGKAMLERLRVERAAVNCTANLTDDQVGPVVLSCVWTAESLARVRAQVDPGRGAAFELAGDPALRFEADSESQLLPVEPLMDCGEAELNPAARWAEPELNNSPASPALASAAGARLISDLALNEKAGRVAAWNSIVGELGTTTEGAVSKLMALRDTTDDLTVADACSRVCAALVEGTADVSDVRGLAMLFANGEPLDAALANARRLLENNPSPNDLEEALAVLAQALAPLGDMGIYLDDRDTVYRYFNSIAERVRYNQTLGATDARRVQLVPDEYYAAHSLAAQILNRLGRNDEALAHSDELVRVAPVTPDAALSKVRTLEELSRVFEAADVLKQALTYASTARDMAILYYRLAFMEWKLGRGQLSIACYQASMALHPEMAEQARQEMADFFEADKTLHELSGEEAAATLEEAGVFVPKLDELADHALKMAAASTDAGVFSVARPFLSVYLELASNDDVLTDVRNSLAHP